MADLEECDFFVHCHLVIFFLLLDKHVSMFSRKGVEEDQVTFLLANHQFIISLEIIIQLEEDFKASNASLWGHILWYFESPF